MNQRPSSSQASERLAIASALIITPVGLAGLITNTPLSFFVAMRRAQALGRDRPAVGRAGLDHHRLDAERLEDIAIGRIARRRDGHPVARVETGEEGENEARRGAGRDGYSLRIDARARKHPGNGARCVRASSRRQGQACSRSAPGRWLAWRPRAPRAGAGAPGSPSSICTTLPPPASMAPARDNTSMAMKGATAARSAGPDLARNVRFGLARKGRSTRLCARFALALPHSRLPVDLLWQRRWRNAAAP